MKPAKTALIPIRSEKNAPNSHAIEIVILSGANPGAPSKKDPRWTVNTLAQYQRKFDSAKKENEKSSFSFRVHWSEGGFSRFVFLKEKISTFDLQTILRESCGDVPTLAREAKAPVHLNLAGLPLADQKKALSTLITLFGTTTWKSPVFGKKSDSKKTIAPVPLELSHFSKINDAEAAAITREAFLLAEANNWVRTLAVLPTNELDPAHYRKWIENYASTKNLRYEFWDVRELERKKAGSFLAVLRADPKTAGGIAKISYKPKNIGKKTRKLVVVGKGLCFDTGGYNIKVGNYMLGMHNDMTGSAVAIALCGLYAELGVDFEVVCYLAIAENLISPTAYKPNEIVIAANGKSIEVVDTDAEGRMVLADTLVLADLESPDLMLDFATLTGAAVRALDTRRAAVFSNQPKLLESAYAAGEASGERTWGFPIGDDYLKELDSKIADIRQCGCGDNSDHIYAATFLSQFVDEKTPWVHMDLTPNENKGGLGLIGTDTTGFGVFWAHALVRNHFKIASTH